MNKTLNTYIVSSADWSIQADGYNSHTATLSAVVSAFSKFGSKLMMSTTIMSIDEENHMLDRIENADFYATEKILNDLGLKDLSNSFKLARESINESKNIKR